MPMSTYRSAALVRTIALSVIIPAITFSAFPQQQSRYKLRNGDSLDLNFVYVPEFNQTITIQPDGYVTLRAIGDVRAGGLTVPELKKAVEAKYTEILKDPDVSIEIKDFEKPF